MVRRSRSCSGSGSTQPEQDVPRRPWCLPPAMLRDPADKLEGDSILAETPGDFGLLLWSLARDVTLWAATPPSARDNLFTSGSLDARFTLLAAADVPPEVSAPVDTLHGMLSLGGRADAGVLSVCCLEVAARAVRGGRPHTGIAFAQAGALAAPEFAEAALTVGVHARAAGQDTRAATWLRRAVALARRERDWAAYAAARVELGGLAEREQPGSAERNYRMAVRVARRHGARSARMRAAHGLFRLARQRGDTAAAAQFAGAAQRVFDPGIPGARALLMDLARFWMDTGQPRRAGPAVQRLAIMMESLDPAHQLVTLAMSARVHAASLKSPRSKRLGALAERAWTLMGDEAVPDAARFAAAFDLAHAAHGVGDRPAFDRARQAVLRFAPDEVFDQVARQVMALWRNAPEPPLDRAS